MRVRRDRVVGHAAGGGGEDGVRHVAERLPGRERGVGSGREVRLHFDPQPAGRAIEDFLAEIQRHHELSAVHRHAVGHDGSRRADCVAARRMVEQGEDEIVFTGGGHAAVVEFAVEEEGRVRGGQAARPA
jgi:hypothetical protein